MHMHTTILLLEPDHDLNRLFQSVLQAEGYRVHALHRWEDAQLVLSTSMPHLIIFDWVGTTTGGYQWLNQLQHTPATACIPVLLLCNDAPATNRPAWSAIADTTIMENPIDLAVLRQQVRVLLVPRAREVGAPLT
jgi:two-component system phosphate regulon response regulator PhoB